MATEAVDGPVGTRPAAPHSQTLDRGLRVLEVLAEGEAPQSSAALAAALGVHRSIVYRILRTLEDHRLVSRRPEGSWELGVGLAVLARSVTPTLRAAALPELAAVANELGVTAFLAVADRDECLTVLSVEPRHSQAHVTYRPGGRHPLDRGAPGIALLAGAPPRASERPEVAGARRAGYALTRGEVLHGMSSVAAPVGAPSGVVASFALVFIEGQVDEDAACRRVVTAAATVARELS